MTPDNPLVTAIRRSFEVKRKKSTGIVPRNWLLILLRLLDRIRETDRALQEDEVYTYDYTLKDSRAKAIPTLLQKYGLPTNLGMSKEGVTVRGAPGLRVFRELTGGQVIMHLSPKQREGLVLEAVEILRTELLLTVSQKPIALSSSAFSQAGTFVEMLLAAVENRSNGRVEQALVFTKLRLRFPNEKIEQHPTFAGDQQTGRDADFSVGNMRVIVSATPKDTHFESARTRANEGREVFMVVRESKLAPSKKRIRDIGYSDRVRVISVNDYVAGNMIEVARDRRKTAHKMCLELAGEYNQAIAKDHDLSLQVVIPTEGNSAD